MKNDRFHSTRMAAELAWGNYETLADLDADIERSARRARWIRRKASK